MMEYIYAYLTVDMILTVLVAVGGFLTIKSILSSFMQYDVLTERMKTLAEERNTLRDTRQRELSKGALRQDGGNVHVKDIVERLSLSQLMDTKGIKARLVMAGYRKQSSVFTFLFFRLVTPVIVLVVGILYVVMNKGDLSVLKGFLIIAGSLALGLFLPGVLLRNMITKRQNEIRTFFADALDLLIICVESGMSIEAALRKVAQEIGKASISTAEELYLTTAELSYLPHRRQAYINLAARTGLDEIKTFTTMLMQSEKYGTSLSQSLMIMGDENRQASMQKAEKKAAGLGPKLTVPMIVFFLPVLFVIILGPAVLEVIKTLAENGI